MAKYEVPSSGETTRKAELLDSLLSLAEIINRRGIIVVVHGCDTKHGQRVRDAIRQNDELAEKIYAYQSKRNDGSYDVNILPENGFSGNKWEFDLKDKEYESWGDMMSPSNVIWRTHPLITRDRLRFMTQPVHQGFSNALSLDSSFYHSKREVKYVHDMRIETGEYLFVMVEPIRTKFALENMNTTFIFPYTEWVKYDKDLTWEVTGRF